MIYCNFLGPVFNIFHRSQCYGYHDMRRDSADISKHFVEEADARLTETEFGNFIPEKIEAFVRRTRTCSAVMIIQRHPRGQPILSPEGSNLGGERKVLAPSAPKLITVEVVPDGGIYRQCRNSPRSDRHKSLAASEVCSLYSRHCRRFIKHLLQTTALFTAHLCQYQLKKCHQSGRGRLRKVLMS